MMDGPVRVVGICVVSFLYLGVVLCFTILFRFSCSGGFWNASREYEETVVVM